MKFPAGLYYNVPFVIHKEESASGHFLIMNKTNRKVNVSITRFLVDGPVWSASIEYGASFVVFLRHNQFLQIDGDSEITPLDANQNHFPAGLYYNLSTLIHNDERSIGYYVISNNTDERIGVHIKFRLLDSPAWSGSVGKGEKFGVSLECDKYLQIEGACKIVPLGFEET